MEEPSYFLLFFIFFRWIDLKNSIYNISLFSKNLEMQQQYSDLLKNGINLDHRMKH